MNGETAVEKKAKAPKAKRVKVAKEKKPKVAKVKVAGRKPTLAPFVKDRKAPFKLYASIKEKEITATVLLSGMIVMDEKEYATPSAVGKFLTGYAVDGWRFWKFNQDGKRVYLDEIRGSKSPLAKAEAA